MPLNKRPARASDGASSLRPVPPADQPVGRDARYYVPSGRANLTFTDAVNIANYCTNALEAGVASSRNQRLAMRGLAAQVEDLDHSRAYLRLALDAYEARAIAKNTEPEIETEVDNEIDEGLGF
jgi:hypothetical protein